MEEELIEELIIVEEISSMQTQLTSCFDDFSRRYDILSSEISVTQNCNQLLTERIVQLERNAVKNAHYNSRESLEINPVLSLINNEVLETNICKALPLIGHEVKPDDLQACHRLKKGDFYY